MVMVHRARAQFCILDEGGGLESHAFIYLISKTAVSPYPCLENNGALCSRRSKGAALAGLHHVATRARDQAQEAKDSAQEEAATIAEVMSARHRPGEDT